MKNGLGLEPWSGGGELAGCADATRASMHARGVAVDIDGGLLDIGDPAARRLAVRVAHVVSKRDSLPTDLAAILHLVGPS